MINKLISRLSVAALVFALASCFETEQEFTLNPDGSGKVVHESKFQPFSMNFGFGGDEPDEEEKMRQAVASIIEKSEGVDAWDDVHFERLDDGRILFRGTAWFSDISKLDIENQMMMNFEWTRDPSANGELSLSLGNDGGEGAGADQNTPPDDEEGRRRWLAGERGKFQQARMMMATMLTGLKHTATFHLPGDAVDAHQFEDAGDGRLKIDFHGEKFLDAIDAVMADDEWLLANGFSGDDAPDMDGVLAEKMFGKPGTPHITRSALAEPLFDYQAEVAAARANAPALEEKLGVAAARLLPPSEGGPLKSAEVVGVRLGLAIDSALDLRPFNHNEGVSLSILCEFDGAILSIDDNKSAVETAVTEDGTSLLQKSDFQRRLRSTRLSEGRTHAIFDVNLAPPPAGATRLRDLAGTIHYSVAAETKEIDLGITKLAEEQRGEELGAEITEIKPGWREDGPLSLSLRLNLTREELVNAWIVRNEAREKIEQRGYSSSGNITTFNFELDKDFDPEARIVVEIHDEIRNFTTPFILRNIALPVIEAQD